MLLLLYRLFFSFFCLPTSLLAFPLIRSAQPALGQITPVQSLCLFLPPFALNLGHDHGATIAFLALKKIELINLTSAVILSVLPAGREALCRCCCLLLELAYCCKAITVNLCAPSVSTWGRYRALCSASARGDTGLEAARWVRSQTLRLPGWYLNENCGLVWAFCVKQGS